MCSFEVSERKRAKSSENLECEVNVVLDASSTGPMDCFVPSSSAFKYDGVIWKKIQDRPEETPRCRRLRSAGALLRTSYDLCSLDCQLEFGSFRAGSELRRANSKSSSFRGQKLLRRVLAISAAFFFVSLVGHECTVWNDWRRKRNLPHFSGSPCEDTRALGEQQNSFVPR